MKPPLRQSRHAAEAQPDDQLGREDRPGESRRQPDLAQEAGETRHGFPARQISADFVELLAYPLLGAYYGSLPEATSVLLYHALARAGLDALDGDAVVHVIMVHMYLGISQGRRR